MILRLHHFQARGTRYFQALTLACCLLFLASACRTTKPTANLTPPKLTLEQVKTQLIQSPVLAQNFTGFALYDLDADTMAISYNADKYFTPASTTKVLSLYAGLKILHDSIPAFRYTVQHDSLLFWGPAILLCCIRICPIIGYGSS